MARILIVDDALFMRQVLTTIFIAEGHEVCGEASNAKDGVEKYKTLKPDLVTMDIVMPMMEELDGIGAVKEITKLPKAKILIISAMSQQALVVEAIRLGAKDFLNKPVNPDRLKDTVRKILANP